MTGKEFANDAWALSIERRAESMTGSGYVIASSCHVIDARAVSMRCLVQSIEA